MINVFISFSPGKIRHIPNSHLSGLYFFLQKLRHGNLVNKFCSYLPFLSEGTLTTTSFVEGSIDKCSKSSKSFCETAISYILPGNNNDENVGWRRFFMLHWWFTLLNNADNEMSHQRAAYYFSTPTETFFYEPHSSNVSIGICFIFFCNCLQTWLASVVRILVFEPDWPAVNDIMLTEFCSTNCNK